MARTVIKRIHIKGHVQGVGFRYHSKHQAEQLGITGWIRNLPDGSVEALICGTDKAVQTMFEWFHHGPRFAHVDTVTITETNIENIPNNFTITQ